MSSRFTALPIGDGESFVLETEQDGRRWVIIVDAGKKSSPRPERNRLLNAIRDHCPGVAKRIDIAVCTHKDNDHAGGFADFIDAWTADSGVIGEFWLPGPWSAALPEALVQPERLAGELATGAAAAADLMTPAPTAKEDRPQRSDHEEATGSMERAFLVSPEGPFTSVEERLRAIRAATSRPEPDGEDTPNRFSKQASAESSAEPFGDEVVARSLGLGTVDLDAIDDFLATKEPSPSFVQRLGARTGEQLQFVNLPEWHRRWGTSSHLEWSQLGRALLHGVAETADIIAAIAGVAVRHRIPVRWFDFEPFENGVRPSGGYPEFFRPLNAVEAVKRPPERGLMLFLSLRLTEQNVASLVFQRVETDSEPAALFLADSRLAFGVNRPARDFGDHLEPMRRPFLYTAPHHGSRNNDHAYQVLKTSWLSDSEVERSYVVRNGGISNQTLADYLMQPNRRCAHCPQCHGGAWGQPVSVGTNGGANWDWGAVSAAPCGTPGARKRRTHRGRRIVSKLAAGLRSVR
jgi:hypothetical protein